MSEEGQSNVAFEDFIGYVRHKCQSIFHLPIVIYDMNGPGPEMKHRIWSGSVALVSWFQNIAVVKARL